jgi:hypothetical protein
MKNKYEHIDLIFLIERPNIQMTLYYNININNNVFIFKNLKITIIIFHRFIYEIFLFLLYSELALQIRLISRVMCGWLPLELGYNKMVESDLLNKLLCKSTTLMEEEFDLSDPNDFDNFCTSKIFYIIQDRII